MHTTTVYLIHLEAPLGSDRKQALHYLGSCTDLTQRLADHRAGRGARMLAAAVERGIGFEVVRTWPGGRAFERSLKARKGAAALCPVCSGAAAYRRAPAPGPQLALALDELELPAAPPARVDWYEIVTQQRWRAAHVAPAIDLAIVDACL